MVNSKIISDFEVISGGDLRRRRSWSDSEKVRIVEESLVGDRQGTAVARRYGLSYSVLTRWRAQYRSGVLGSGDAVFSPVVVSPAGGRSRDLQSFGPVAAGGDARIEVALANGRRVYIPVGFDPVALARLLPVLDER